MKTLIVRVRLLGDTHRLPTYVYPKPLTMMLLTDGWLHKPVLAASIAPPIITESSVWNACYDAGEWFTVMKGGRGSSLELSDEPRPKRRVELP